MKEQIAEHDHVRVGDFTGAGTDDVFWIASNIWHLWDPAFRPWSPLWQEMR